MLPEKSPAPLPAGGPPFLASACLCGIVCRYDGASAPHPEIEKLYEAGLAIPVCPEELGGLATPRVPCEIRNGRVIDATGADNTDAFLAGAAKALALAKELGITRAVFKDKSPSCGRRLIYDGSFTRTLVPGQGITAALFIANGIEVMTEDAACEPDFLQAGLCPAPRQGARPLHPRC